MVVRATRIRVLPGMARIMQLSSLPVVRDADLRLAVTRRSGYLVIKMISHACRRSFPHVDTAVLDHCLCIHEIQHFISYYNSHCFMLINEEANMSKSSLLADIEADKPQLIQFLQSLIRAASPNPPGNTVAAAAVVKNFLNHRGIDSESIEPQKNAPNIVSIFPSSEPLQNRRRNLVINGHLDVFPVPNSNDWIHEPWSGDIEKGRIYGRGVVDMKAGLAASVAAYAYLYARRSMLSGTAVLEAVSDEETGGKWGSRWLIEQDERKEIWKGDAVLNAEPTGLQSVRFAEKGTLRMTFMVRTKGGHGAYVHLDEGAVRVAARLIKELVELEKFDEFELDPGLRRQLGREDVRGVIDEIMGPGASGSMLRPSVNIGTIRGGSKVNTIPSECDFEVDIRLPAGLTAQILLNRIDAVLEDFPEAKYAVQEAASNPPNACSPDHPLADAIQDNAERVTGRRPMKIPSMGATDCKHWRYMGIPAFSYGLSPEGMAGTDESVSLDDYIKLVKVLTLATWDFLGGGD